MMLLLFVLSFSALLGRHPTVKAVAYAHPTSDKVLDAWHPECMSLPNIRL